MEPDARNARGRSFSPRSAADEGTVMGTSQRDIHVARTSRVKHEPELEVDGFARSAPGSSRAPTRSISPTAAQRAGGSQLQQQIADEVTNRAHLESRIEALGRQFFTLTKQPCAAQEG